MDKALIRQRFAKATDAYDRQAGMQKHVARHMAEAIKSHIPDSDGWNVLEIGCGTGLFTREYLRGLRPGRLLLNDICPEMEPYCLPPPPYVSKPAMPKPCVFLRDNI